MNSIVSNFSVSPKKEWMTPEIKGFELNETKGGTYSRAYEAQAYHSQAAKAYFLEFEVRKVESHLVS